MLLGSKVNALSVSRQCFTRLKAMLFNTGNNAFQSFTDSETVQNRKMDEKTLPVVRVCQNEIIDEKMQPVVPSSGGGVRGGREE